MKKTLLLITLIGLCLRLVLLSSLPISLFGDEVDVGYHAWSLFTTGRDYTGHLLPTLIRSLAEYRAPLLMYITAPFVGLLGPSAFSVRLPVALLGTFSIPLIALLIKQLTQNKRYALLAALFLAISPTHLHYSRAAFEVVPLIFLLILGTYLFIRKSVYLSLIPFILTLYTYSTAFVFTPLFVVGLYLIYKPSLNLKSSLTKLILPLILILPLVYNTFWGQAGSRFSLISVWSDQTLIDEVILKRTETAVIGNKYEAIFHNKYLAIAKQIITNYATSFSPSYLFLKGDPFYRHSPNTTGTHYLVILPFFIYGLYHLFRSFHESSAKVLLLWLFLSPLPSSLTQGGGTHATRLFLMVPPILAISAIGFWELALKIKHKLFLIIPFAIALLVSLTFLIHEYYAHYRINSARFWHYGSEQIFTALRPHLKDNINLYINNTHEPSLLKFAFYTKLPPRQFQAMFKGDDPASYQTSLFSGFRFGDNYYFGQVKNLESLDKLLQPGDIYLGAQLKEIPGDWDWSQTPPANFQVLESVKDKNNQPLFTIFTKKQ